MKRSIRHVVTMLLPGCLALACSTVAAQHYLLRGGEAPGSLAHKRLIAEPAIGNYDQPVQIIVPQGGQVSSWQNSGASDVSGTGALLGMQVGPVYQLKIDVILRGIQHTVFPTVEMLDRLYPPPGLATHHPVKLVVTDEDIEDATAGRMITKVIYLENPDTALPYRQQFDEQASIDVGPGQDPFVAADRLGRPLAIVRIGSRHPIAGDNESMYQYAPVQMFDSGPIDTDLNIYSADDCLPVICQPACRCSVDEVARLPKSRRDEYVCDGDDRDLKVVATAEWKLHGLELEDTIAHYDTLDGRVLIVPSNRVCIYSPRFASVRRVLQTNDETITQRLNVAREKTPVALAAGNDFSTTTLQNIQLQSNRKTMHPQSFRDRTRGVVTENRVKLHGTRHHFKPFEDLQLIRFGKFSSSESARLSMALQSAVAWEGDVSAQITINKNQPVIVRDVSSAQELVAIDSDTDPNLRLCKLASRISALPGETVDFTIRFDNIGREKIGNVTIVDNLSPRLEYIQGSAECSVEAGFSSETNEAGSRTLRWEITAPLEVSTGGLIRFQCRVR